MDLPASNHYVSCHISNSYINSQFRTRGEITNMQACQLVYNSNEIGMPENRILYNLERLHKADDTLNLKLHRVLFDEYLTFKIFALYQQDKTQDKKHSQTGDQKRSKCTLSKYLYTVYEGLDSYGARQITRQLVLNRRPSLSQHTALAYIKILLGHLPSAPGL